MKKSENLALKTLANHVCINQTENNHRDVTRANQNDENGFRPKSEGVNSTSELKKDRPLNNLS